MHHIVVDGLMRTNSSFGLSYVNEKSGATIHMTGAARGLFEGEVDRVIGEDELVELGEQIVEVLQQFFDG